MPQFDLSTYFSQIFWLVLSFGILYLMMHYVFIPKMTEIIEKRNKQISVLLKKADKLKLEAKYIDESIKTELANAEAEIKTKINEVIAINNKKLSDEMMKLEQKLSEQIIEAEERAKKFAIEEPTKLAGLISEVVECMLQKLIHIEMPRSEIEKVVHSTTKLYIEKKH